MKNSNIKGRQWNQQGEVARNLQDEEQHTRHDREPTKYDAVDSMISIERLAVSIFLMTLMIYGPMSAFGGKVDIG
jgi:hypothetical protein